MEGHKKSRGRKNRRIFSSKRLTSFLLALAMICTNVIADLNTAYAAGASTEVAFEMRGADLVAAVEDAIASGNVVTPDDLNFTAGKAEEFKGYLFGTGTLYEAYPDLEGGDVNAEMRVFVRLPEDADDMYAVTGDEEIIFLYVNNSDETISFRSYISYTADGEEKIKKTDRVTVRSYESTFGDEEVNVISDPVEPEIPAEVPDETEPETPETDPVATESELTVSMSPNVAAFVAVPGDELATPSDLPEASAPSGDESGDPDETDGSQPAEGNTEPEETTTVEETTAPADETKTPADPEEIPAEGNEPVATEPEIPTAAKPNYGDLVAIGWSSTAKLYSSTLNKLHALDDVEGWEIRYSIAPEGAARIIDGPRGVEDGEDLYFGVKNQIGYTVDTVLANGEELTADTVTDNGDGSQTVWYNVPEVSEEQSIDVVMTESGEHPAFEQVLTMDDGMVITIRAGEGVLPAGVTATAARVSQEVEDEVAESASEDGKAVTSVYAYDINLWLGDQLLDSEIWGGSRKVEVTFSGTLVEEVSEQSETIEVVHVNVGDAKEKTDDIAAADITGIETVSDTVEVPAEESVQELSFEAEHFSIYAFVGHHYYKNHYEMYVGQEIRLEAYETGISGVFGEWKSSDPETVEILQDNGVRWDGIPYAKVKANKASEKDVKITFHYGLYGRQEFTISVKDHQATAYFYVQRPGVDPKSLADEDWKYVGTGTISTSGLKNQQGGTLESGKGQYALNIEGNIITFPDEQTIKDRIAQLYEVNVNEAEITYTPYKISYPNGYKDENDNAWLEGKPCYHVDMSVSVTTKNTATANYYLWDAGEQGAEPVESQKVSIGSTTEPKKTYPPTKNVGGINYEFDGWYTNPDYTGEKVRFPYTVEMAVSFYARYVKNPIVNIQYVGVHGTVNPQKETIKANDGFDAVQGSTAGRGNNGYVFKGWYNNKDGTGEPLSANNYYKPQKPPTGWEDATYYAVFEKISNTSIEGPYVTIEGETDRDPHHQGTVQVEVYLDGEKVDQNSGEIAYGYKEKNTIDLQLGYLQSNKVVLNGIYADGKATVRNDGKKVCDVPGGSTVYIYLSSIYTVQYRVDQVTAPTDGNKYTIPSKKQDVPNGYSKYEPKLKGYVTDEIIVKDFPKLSGYSFNGWFAETKEEVKPWRVWRLEDAVQTDENGDHIIELNAITEIQKLIIKYQSENRERGTVSPNLEMLNATDDATGSTATANDGWAFKYWTNSKGKIVSWNEEYVPEKVNGVHVKDTYTAHFGTDENGDGIPDMYQIKVTYKAVNGTVSFDKTYVTLWKDGHYATEKEGGVGTLEKDQIATATPNPGYDAKKASWTPKTPVAGMRLSRDTNFVVTFKESNRVTIAYLPDDIVHGYTTNPLDWIAPVTGQPEGSTAQAWPGVAVAFKYWTKMGDETVVSWDAQLKPEDIKKNADGIYENAIYIAHFGEDQDKDGIPDEYQTKVTFKAVNGYFDEPNKPKEITQTVTLRDADGHYSKDGSAVLTNVPTPIPEEGYAGGTWDPNPYNAVITKDSPKEFIVTFVKNDYNVKVEYHFNGVCDINKTEWLKLPFGTTYDAEPKKTLVWSDGRNYALDRAVNNPVTVRADATLNVIGLFYELDEIGEGGKPDEKPDKYQTIVTFKAVNGYFNEKENLTEIEHVVTLKDGSYILSESDLPKADPNPGYRGGEWTPNPVNAVIEKDGENVFTITFVPDDMTGRVEFYFDEVRDDTMTAPLKEELGSTYQYAAEESLDHNGHHYALDRVENGEFVVDLDPEQNVVKVYYAVDEIGDTTEGNEPDQPDGIPDKYQIRFAYQLDDPAHGTISGTVVEVRTMAEKNEDGTYEILYSEISPNAAVTITPADGYRFAHWQDQNGTVYSTTEALKATSFEDDMTFTAYFETTGGEDPDNPGGEDPDNPGGEDPDNPSTPGGDDNPGGGNGSGSSNGGSGGSSSGGGSPYAPATSGPGVTIDADAVPLAPLPDGGTSFVIDEDSVPLAPLPKTGQQPIRTQVTMLFAGIFLALASVRKRKEEN